MPVVSMGVVSVFVAGWLGCSGATRSAPAPTPRMSVEELSQALPAHVGKVVELEGYFYANSAGDDYIRVILLGAPDNAARRADCMTLPSSRFKGLERHTPLVVTGRVVERDGKVRLEECSRVVESD